MRRNQPWDFPTRGIESDDDPSRPYPHESKLVCDALKANDEVYGGAKPYEMTHESRRDGVVRSGVWGHVGTTH